jgi:hypothetical protein
VTLLHTGVGVGVADEAGSPALTGEEAVAVAGSEAVAGGGLSAPGGADDAAVAVGGTDGGAIADGAAIDAGAVAATACGSGDLQNSPCDGRVAATAAPLTSSTVPAMRAPATRVGFRMISPGPRIVYKIDGYLLNR